MFYPRSTFILLYVLIFLLGILGNSCFCYIVCTAAGKNLPCSLSSMIDAIPGMRTVTYYFLLNLSLADIAITIFCTLNKVSLSSFLQIEYLYNAMS